MSKKLLAALPLFALACTGPTKDPKGGVSAGIAVINSDYRSTSVSLIDPETGKVTSDGCLSSGSQDPVLSLPLSGDVALPSQAQPGNELVLIDRGNAAISWVDPMTCKVRRQLSVATGFTKINPHDVVGLYTTKAYVLRYEKDAHPAEANGGGDDVLIVNPYSGAISGRIDLSSYATDGTQARPDRAVYANGKIYVALGNISGDFMTYGSGRVVVIDTATDKVTSTIDAPFKNCNGIDYIAASQTLLLACGGDFNGDQMGTSGVVAFDVSGATAKQLKSVPASTFGHPISTGTFAAINDHLVAVGVSGDFSGTPPDALYTYDLTAGSAAKIADAGGSFVLGTVLSDGIKQRVYVSDAEKSGPKVSIFDAAHTPLAAAGGVESSPKSGLPPRQLSWY